ncbi:FAD-binding domain-containing protein [Xylaria palmicola]|nr:FAD-binding domain-containing protein [Xylaria palmicola]
MSPAAFVRPQGSTDVAETLKIVTKANIKFALRTQGHNPNSGFNSTGSDGIVIDLQNLRSMSLNATRGVLHVGSGATWDEVYEFLEKKKLSAIGGRNGSVGLAGFLLGGGYPALPNPHGFGADGVKSFEVVLADSSIVTADSEKNANLFQALKGGGLSLHPLIEVQYTLKLYAESDFENIIGATMKAQKAMEHDSRPNIFTNFRNGFVVVGLLYAGCPGDEPKAFQPFSALSSLMNTLVPKTNGTILSLAKAMAHEIKPMKRTIGSVTTKVSYDLYIEVYKAWKGMVSELPAGVEFHYTIQPVSASAVQAGENQGRDIMGLEKDSQCWWVFTAEWPEDDQDQVARQAVSTTVKAVQDIAIEKGLLLEYLCMNFADSTQDVRGSYGSANLQKLRDVAAQYDPQGVFQNLQNDGFLLRKV